MLIESHHHNINIAADERDGDICMDDDKNCLMPAEQHPVVISIHQNQHELMMR